MKDIGPKKTSEYAVEPLKALVAGRKPVVTILGGRHQQRTSLSHKRAKLLLK